MTEQYLYNTNKKEATKLNVWCAFPAVYNFGMSALGFLTVFRQIDSIDGIYAERIFTDSENHKLKVQDVDLITFSFSFELDYLGILTILKKYKVNKNYFRKTKKSKKIVMKNLKNIIITNYIIANSKN